MINLFSSFRWILLLLVIQAVTSGARLVPPPELELNRRETKERVSTGSDSSEEDLKSGGEMSFGIGSRPPSCFNKCNACFPCQPVQVPTAPLNRHHKLHISGVALPPSSSSFSFSSPSPSSSSSSSSSSSPKSMSSQGQISSEYSNYKPEGWKCKCGSKVFNP